MKKLVITLIIIFISILFIPLWTVFSFKETRNENPEQYYIPINEKNDFQIEFTHSIHLTDVLESYRVLNSNQIRLLSMQYSDVAIGMPSYAEEGQTLLFENGIYTLHYDNAILDDFILHIGDVGSKLFLNYGGQSFNLKEELVRGRSYLFEVRKLSLFEIMRGVKLNGSEKSEIKREPV